MALICSISGVQPEEPCLSKTGYVFERRLIELHLQESSICPATGEPLTVDDLIPIKCDLPVKPRPATATSIPGLLSLFQSEWDAIALETFNLRSHIDVVQRQLSHSLYQHDAATRVIARIIKERDVALEQVEALQKQLVDFKSNFHVNNVEIGLTDDEMNRLQDLAKALMADRKKRDLSIYNDIDVVRKFKLVGEYRTHSSTIPGVNCVCVDAYRKSQEAESSFCFTGGADGSIVYFDLNLGKTVSKMTNHLKSVNALEAHAFAPILVSGSDDKTIRVWKLHEANEFKCINILKHHKSPITSLSIHPSGEYLLSTSRDGIWVFCDLDSGKVIRMVRDIEAVCSRGKFHPDGLIAAGAGSDGGIYVWDFRQMSIINSLKNNNIPLVDLDLSENGYHLAALKENGVLEMWDLRKSSTFCLRDCNSSPTRIRFDPSGRIVAVASTKIELYNLADKNSIEFAHCIDQGHDGYITDVCFGLNSEQLLTTCKDKALRIFKN